MEPIINPWLIYLASVVDNISFTSVMFSLLFGAAFFTIVIIYLVTKVEDGDCRESKILGLWSIRSGIAALIALLFATFTPSQSTMITMIAANAITPNAIEAAAEAGKDVVDYIVKTVEDLIDGTDEDETTAEEEETEE